MASLQWPGYDSWHDNIHVFDHTTATRPYTLEKLAHVVSKAVHKFMTVCPNAQSRQLFRFVLTSLVQQDMSNVQSTERRPDWWLRTIRFEDLVLLELRHVSKGSWQPVLCRVVRQ